MQNYHKNQKGQRGPTHNRGYRPQGERHTATTGSLYESFLSHGRLRVNPDIMSSLSAKPENNKEDYQAKSFFFKYTIPNTNLEIERTLDVLENLEKQSVKKWISRFYETSSILNWTTEIALKVLQAIISPTLYHLVQTCQSIEQVTGCLLQAQHPPEKALTYYRDLSLIRQKNFYRIKDYFHTLELITEKLAICKSWTDQELRFKLEEVFFGNLAPLTSVEVIRQNLVKASDVVNRISAIEDTLIKQRETQTYNKNRSGFRENQRGKYCRYHKVTTHDSSECNFLKNSRRNNSQKYNRDSDQNNFIREPNENPRLITLEGAVNTTSVTCLVDTGALGNFVSNELVQKSGLEIQKIEPKKIELADSSVVEVSQMADISLKLNQIPGNTYKLSAKILPSTPYSIILGSDFLLAHGCQIDYVEGKLKLDEQEIEFISPNIKAWNENPDRNIVDKLCHTNPLVENKRGIIELINQAKQNNPELGKMPVTPHEIHLSRSPKLQARSYPLPLKLKEPVQKEIQRLLELNVIRISNSTTVSPAFPVLKKDGSIRLVVDFRALNLLTTKGSYPLPDVRNTILELRGMKFFSALNLNMGYYQIPMERKSVALTSFIIGRHQYEFLRMPFGLCDAPRSFQRAIDNMFHDVSNVWVYLDDILVASESLEKHKLDLKKVFQILQQNNASVNFKKSQFCLTEIKFLGQVISQSGIRADISRVNELHLEPPRSKKELQRLLGTLNWFRPFVRNASKKLLPLTDKLSMLKNFQWRKEDTNSLDKVVKEIKEQTILNHPDLSKPFQLQTDASDRAVGSVLFQNQNLISFHSAKLSKSQINYTIVEKELLGILLALETFKPIIYNSPIQVETDNRNISFEPVGQNRRWTRWKSLLEEYEVKIIHLAGDKNNCADYLSRVAVLNPLLIPNFEIPSLRKFFNEQIQEFNELNRETSRTIIFLGNKLLVNSDSSIPIPTKLLEAFISEMHTELGHPGAEKLYRSLREFWQHKELRKSCFNYCKTCIDCQTAKVRNFSYGRVAGSLAILQKNDTISSDIMGPFSSLDFQGESPTEKFYLITLTDLFSRFTLIQKLENIDSNSIQGVFKEWFETFGTPNRLITDRGRQYLGSPFLRFLQTNGVTHQPTTAYHPEGNGVSERLNQTIKTLLRIHKGKNLEQALTQATNNLNRTYHRIIGTSPELLMKSSSSLDPLNRDSSKYYNQAIARIQRRKALNIEQENEKRVAHTFRVDDKILIRSPRPNKIESRFNGPFKIIAISSTGRNLHVDHGSFSAWYNVNRAIPALERRQDVAMQGAS